MKQRVCICGGGNLGHVVTGFLAIHGDCEVSLLTRHPERWQRRLTIRMPEGDTRQGEISVITSRPAEVIPTADIVLLCLPGFSIREELQLIRPFLQTSTAVGSIVSSTGFFFEALELLPTTTPLFGFQRVPFIAADKARLCSTLEQLFHTPTTLMQSYYEVSLTNSNPILHPSRLYTMWKDWHEGIVYPVQPKFYEEWTDEASALLIVMDCEFQQLLQVLPVREGSIPTILDYYESSDASSLTRKLRSIQAFKGILAPMKAVEGGFVPDFSSRYFTEDFPYGLRIIQQQARKHQIPVPTIDRVMAWGIKKTAL